MNKVVQNFMKHKRTAQTHTNTLPLSLCWRYANRTTTKQSLGLLSLYLSCPSAIAYQHTHTFPFSLSLSLSLSHTHTHTHTHFHHPKQARPGCCMDFSSFEQAAGLSLSNDTIESSPLVCVCVCVCVYVLLTWCTHQLLANIHTRLAYTHTYAHVWCWQTTNPEQITDPQSISTSTRDWLNTTEWEQGTRKRERERATETETERWRILNFEKAQHFSSLLS